MKLQKRITITLCLLFALTGFNEIQAQLKAVQDNYFIAESRKKLNILANDNWRTCSEDIADIIIEIERHPDPAFGVLSAPDNAKRLTYTPVRDLPNKIRQTSFAYKIACIKDPTNFTDTVTVYLNFGTQPDFMTEVECLTAPPSFIWRIAKVAQTKDSDIGEYAHLLAGPVKNNGETKILTTNRCSTDGSNPGIFQYYGDRILVYDSDLNKREEIILENPTVDNNYKKKYVATYGGSPMALANVEINGVKRTLIIVALSYNGPRTTTTGSIYGNHQYLRAYYYDDSTNAYEPAWNNPENASLLIQGASVYDSDKTWSDNIKLDKNPCISIADIDGDGNVEILCGDRIFAAESGKCLGELPIILPNKNNGDLDGRGTDAFEKTIWHSHVWGDVNGDGKMEAVCGNTTYTVKIISRTDMSQNKVEDLARAAKINSTDKPYPDGYSAVADIDGDGVLDVITMAPGKAGGPNSRLYVWQGSSGNLLADIAINAPSVSPPLIGDIVGDPTSTIKNYICFSFNLGIAAFYYEPPTVPGNTGTLKQKWVKNTTDSSGRTLMSLFDFNNDGAAELVYRDEENIRIIDGDSGENINVGKPDEAKFPCFSGTGIEYPIVVDDGKGKSAIYVSGAEEIPTTSPTVYFYKMRIMKFDGSSSTSDNNWVQARKVWNQQNYNPTQVNEDLSIPKYPLDPASFFYKKDGTKWQPFNTVLAQTGPLSSYAEPYTEAADLTFKLTAHQKLDYDIATKTVTVTATIENIANVTFDKELNIELYLYNTISQEYRLAFGEKFSPISIPHAKSITKVFSAQFELVSPNVIPGDQWVLAVNGVNNSPNAPDFDPPHSQEECDYANNITRRISFLSGALTLCEDNDPLAHGDLILSPASTYTYKWYTKDAGNNYHQYKGHDGNDTDNTGDKKTVLKTTSDRVDTYYIEVWDITGTSLISPIKEEVYVYLTPQELEWTGNEDSNWHNIMNWNDPMDTGGQYANSYIPRYCTSVTIPAGLAIYPDLTDIAQGGNTDYSVYNKAECNTIRYKHSGGAVTAGEVARPDSLNYVNVEAEIDVVSNRHYSLAFPLQDMYTRDFHRTNINPYNDGVYSWTQLYELKNPERDKNKLGHWTGYFNTPNVHIEAGNGIAYFFDDGFEGQPSVNFQFQFPKNIGTYHVYGIHPPHASNGVSYPASRTNSSKYIFSPLLDGTKENVLTEIKIDRAPGETYLFGNPFLSHLDFEVFYEANKTLIKDHYWVLQGDETSPIPGEYGMDAFYLTGGTTSGSPELTKYIAPWQSVIIEMRATVTAGQKLVVPVKASVNYVQNDGYLRSQKKNEYITIGISDNKMRSRTILAHKPQATSQYDESFDIQKNFFIEYYTEKGTVIADTDRATSAIYTITSDGYSIERKGIGSDKTFEIPIGLKTNYKGSMTLTFENAQNFLPELEEICLLDKYTKAKIVLNRNSHWPTTYRFTHEGKEYESNDRFVLIGTKVGTSIEEDRYGEDELNVRFSNGRLTAQAPNDQTIIEVNIYDLTGKRVKAASKLQLNTYETLLGESKAVYILNVTTDKQVYNQKIINQSN